MKAEPNGEVPPDWINGDPVRLRSWRDLQPEVIAPELPSDVDLIDLSDTAMGGIECRPHGRTRGTILHFHGGGFVAGSPHTHRCVGAWLAHVFRRIVWLCPWPLAPEHVLPEQSQAAVERLGQAARFYGDGILLSGDSAGALMAIWAWHGANAAQRRAVDGLLLIYGYYGIEPESGDEADGLGPLSVRAMKKRLDPSGCLRADPALSPLAGSATLHGNTVIIGASDDPLLGNSLALARQHPRSTLLLVDAPHGFLSSKNQSPGALKALSDAKAALL